MSEILLQGLVRSQNEVVKDQTEAERVDLSSRIRDRQKGLYECAWNPQSNSDLFASSIVLKNTSAGVTQTQLQSPTSCQV